MPWLKPSSHPASGTALLALGALALAAAIGWTWRPTASGADEGSAAPPPAAPGSFRPAASQLAAMALQPVRAELFDTVAVVDGSVAVDDNATVSVYSQYSGRIIALHAQPGDFVRRGAPLASLLAAEPAQAGSELAAAVAAEATARRQLDLATATERRQHELFVAEAGAEKDWRQSQSELVAAQGALHAAAAALNAARTRSALLAPTPGSGAGGSTPATISSPIAGVVLQRQAAPGQLLSSLANGGATPLFTISDLRRVWVLGNVVESEIARVHVGQPVEISGPALDGRVLRASVRWISSTLDPATRRMTLRADVANTDGLLKPQMSLTLRVLETRPRAVLAVPRSALVYDGAEVHCYVARPDGTLQPRRLGIGRVQGTLAEVRSGLAEGERVVTRGALFIDRAAQDQAP